MSSGRGRATASARMLPAIVVAQLLGTSPWFAVNALMPDLQAGFIVGTLAFALLAVADRFAARAVFLTCALAASLCTIAAALSTDSIATLAAWRAATGLCLAGIYPVGMKIASQWFPQGLGSALGWLVGALVLGSASPHAMRALALAGGEWPWQVVFAAVATVTAGAGLLVWVAVPPAPAAIGPGPALRLSALANMWTDRKVRASVLGDFGHMVELYTMWVLVPAIVATRAGGVWLSWAAFVVLGVGAVGCVGGGLAVRRIGSARVAAIQLAISGACCIAAPWALGAELQWFALWLLVWGVTVVGDSPQFSTLTAKNAPPAAVGSVLTLTNSIGFAISIVSIEIFVRLAQAYPLQDVLPWLAVGPLVGLLALAPLWRAGH